ncbi:hypothetical protein Q1695_004605 [Nippostrongylus brasiliensis]|nr:hypothetical protein Q1695_004605 [Nippostrongylus brasiliensis]
MEEEVEQAGNQSLFDTKMVDLDDEANATALPEWNPSASEANETNVFLLSFMLLFGTLVLPLLILFCISWCARSTRRSTYEVNVPEHQQELDEFFDNDGVYRKNKFEGMLSEDAADDVEIPPKSDDDGASVDVTTKHEKRPGMKNASTQTDELFAYGMEKIALDQKCIPRFDIPYGWDHQKIKDALRRASQRRTHRETKRQRIKTPDTRDRRKSKENTGKMSPGQPSARPPKAERNSGEKKKEELKLDRTTDTTPPQHNRKKEGKKPEIQPEETPKPRGEEKAEKALVEDKTVDQDDESANMPKNR